MHQDGVFLSPSDFFTEGSLCELLAWRGLAGAPPSPLWRLGLPLRRLAGRRLGVRADGVGGQRRLTKSERYGE